MKVHPDTVFNNVFWNIHVSIPYITSSISYEPDTVHLQLEVIRQDIQDNTSDYLANIPTHNTNLLEIAYVTIN